jgi:hypothetical protein
MPAHRRGGGGEVASLKAFDQAAFVILNVGGGGGVHMDLSLLINAKHLRVTLCIPINLIWHTGTIGTYSILHRCVAIPFINKSHVDTYSYTSTFQEKYRCAYARYSFKNTVSQGEFNSFNGIVKSIRFYYQNLVRCAVLLYLKHSCWLPCD